MSSKVRYLTISRVAIELVSSLSDKENKQFNQILFSCFQQLENGHSPEYTETNSQILNIALREAVAELETGYKNYSQRVNARKKANSEQDTESPINQRSNTDESPMNQRLTIEEKRREKEKKISEERGLEGMQGETEKMQQAQMLFAWSKGFLSPADYESLIDYISSGGDTEKARIALHKWKDNGKKGKFFDYIEK